MRAGLAGRQPASQAAADIEDATLDSPPPSAKPIRGYALYPYWGVPGQALGEGVRAGRLSSSSMAGTVPAPGE